MGLFSRSVIGVDIGHSSIKVVSLRAGRKPVFLACKEVTFDSKFAEKEGLSHPQRVGEAIREALKTATPKPISSGPVYTVVSESLVFRKIIELPILAGHDQILQVIELEVAEYLPQPQDEMEIDYQCLGLNEEGKIQQIMVVAVAKNVINSYVDAFKAAKLPLIAIDVKPSAIGRAIIRNDEKEPIFMLDIGSDITTISLYEGGYVWAASTLNMGGNVTRDADTGEEIEDKAPAIARLAEEIADEIDHVTKFFLNHSSNENKAIKEARLMGSGSIIPGITEACKKIVDLKVVEAQPVLEVSKECDRRFMGALGGALYPVYADK